MTPSNREAPRSRARSVAALAAFLGLAGCAQEKPSTPPPRPPVVKVAKPISREVADFEDFVGQTMAVMTIDVRARVTGYLDKVNFDDGAEVEKDTVALPDRPPAVPGRGRSDQGRPRAGRRRTAGGSMPISVGPSLSSLASSSLGPITT